MDNLENFTNALQLKQYLCETPDEELAKMNLYVTYSDDIPSGEFEANVDFTEVQIVGSAEDV